MENKNLQSSDLSLSSVNSDNSHTIDKKEKSNQEKTIDVDAKNHRNKSIVKLSIILLILGAIIALVVWRCTPKYKSIYPKSTAVSDNQLTLTLTNENDINYVIDLSRYDNVEAYYLGIGSDGVANEKQLQVIASTHPNDYKGVVEFKATIYFNFNDVDPKISSVYINGCLVNINNDGTTTLNAAGQ